MRAFAVLIKEPFIEHERARGQIEEREKNIKGLRMHPAAAKSDSPRGGEAAAAAAGRARSLEVEKESREKKKREAEKNKQRGKRN